MQLPERSALLIHRIISALRDINVRGVRRFSVWLPKVLLRDPAKVEKHVLHTLHGIKLVIDPANDSGVELSLYETGTYEKGTIQLLHRFLAPGDVFVDVGANIGLMSCVASKLVGAAGKVIAVEPNPGTAEILRTNLQLNHCGNVETLEIGLAAEPGAAQLFENLHVNRGGASIINQGRSCDPENVSHDIQLATLDSLVGKNTVRLIKIDVEGFELEVLKGAEQTIRSQMPVMIVEVSESRTSDESSSPAEVYEYLKSLDCYTFYKQKGTKERRSKLVPILGLDDLPAHDNIVCIGK